MPSIDKENMAKKIRSLLSLADDPSATEAEALNAAQKAKALLDKYQMELGAVELLEEGFVEEVSNTHRMESWQIHELLAGSIAKYTETKSFNSGLPRSKIRQCVFFGLKSDVAFAIWLSQALELFILRQAAELKHNKRQYKWRKLGLIDGIAARIDELVQQREQERRQNAPAGGNSLVSLDKLGLVSTELNRIHDIGPARKRRMRTDDFAQDAYQTGQDSAKNAPLNKPIEEEKERLQIQQGGG